MAIRRRKSRVGQRGISSARTFSRGIDIPYSKEDLALMEQQKQLGLERRRQLFSEAMANSNGKCKGCLKNSLKRRLGLK